MKQNTKTLILILIVVLLGGIAYYSSTKGNTVSDGPLRNFAVADTSSVSKFTISDTEGNTITISRENSEKTWMVDGTEFKAKPENATLILDALNRTVIRQDLDDPEIETTLKYLAVRHKKVEIYLNHERSPSKTWYIGNGTADHQGTYMLLQVQEQKSTIPFIVYKPGMRGTLDARFFTSFSDWRYTGIYNYGVGEIRNIDFINTDNTHESFSITVDKDSKVNLLDQTKNSLPAFDTAQVSHYVTHYKKLFFNQVVTSLSDAQIDSVTKVNPNVIISVTDKTNTTKKVSIWKIFDKVETEEGTILKLNPGYAYASINNSKELVKLQYHQWDNALKPLSYFLPKTQ